MAFHRTLQVAAAHLEMRLLDILNCARHPNGARMPWGAFIRGGERVEFFCDLPDAVFLATIERRREYRGWQMVIVRRQQFEIGRCARAFVKEEDAWSGGERAFLAALRKCIAGLTYYADEQCLAKANSERVLGIALEDSRPIPGSDLHEVRVQLPSAAPHEPPSPAAEEPKRISFREFL